MELKQGDIVAYSAEFLRSIADYSKRSADKRFKVLRVEQVDKDFTLVHFEMNSLQTTNAANIKNLRKVKNGMVIE